MKATDLRNSNNVLTLTTGIKVKINVAPAMLIEKAANSVKLPNPPVQELEDGRKVENPVHPDYLEERQKAIRLQSQAAIDVMIAFVDLVDPLPEGWEKRIKYLQKLGHVDIGEYDLKDPDDREFIFKKYIAFGSADMELLAVANGISEGDRELAKNLFQG